MTGVLMFFNGKLYYVKSRLLFCAESKAVDVPEMDQEAFFFDAIDERKANVAIAIKEACLFELNIVDKG